MTHVTVLNNYAFYDRKFSSTKLDIVKMDENLNRVDSFDLRQYLNVPYLAPCWIQSIQKMGYNLDVTFGWSEFNQGNFTGYNGILTLDDNLNVLSLHGDSASLNGHFRANGSVVWNNQKYAYGQSRVNGLLLPSFVKLVDIQDTTQYFQMTNAVDSINMSIEQYYDAEVLSDGNLLLKTPMTFQVYDGNFNLVSSGRTGNQGVVPRWSENLSSTNQNIPKLFKDVNGEVKGVGFGTYLDSGSSSTSGYADGLCFILSSPSATSSTSLVDTFNIPFPNLTAGVSKYVGFDYYDISDPSELLFVMRTRRNSQFNTQDSGVITIGSIDPITHQLNWMKNYSNGYNFDTWCVIDRFDDGRILLGFLEYNWGTWSYPRKVFHWVLLDSDATISVPEDLHLDFELTASPNPVNSSFTIEGIEHISGKVEFKLIDALGRLIHAGVVSPHGSVTLDRTSIPSGQYVLSLSNEENQLGSIRLVLQ